MCTIHIFRDSSASPNKILCYTRTSPLIHDLPSQFHMKGQATLQISAKKIKELIIDDIEQLALLKLSGVVTQTVIDKFLKNFLQSDKTKVCTLLINMQETSRQIVNHLRIMIEEAESEMYQPNKLFFLILYFPPSQIFKPCYPSRFLKGWDHWYLDCLAQKSINAMVDIKDWCLQCCVPHHRKQLECSDSLLGVLKETVPQAIPVLTSRLFIGVHDNVSLNTVKQTRMFEALLFDKGASEVLCKRFRSYWNPSEMSESLERAASFSKHKESTLNMTESMQAMYKALFFDFLVYMMHEINDHFNVNIILCEDKPAIHQLFLSVLSVLPLPPLNQLSVLSSNLQVPLPVVYHPSFPFFHRVNGLMEQIFEESLEEANMKMDLFDNDAEQNGVNGMESIWLNMQYDKNYIMENLQCAVTTRIKAQMNVCI